MTKNYRGRWGPDDLGRIQRPNLKGKIVEQQTKHKAIMAWIAATAGVAAAIGIPVPEFVTGEYASMAVTAVLSVATGGVVGWLTWLIPNKSK